ncbi:MAG: PilZ domain-containing protein [Acidobacteriaceae bacterium]
MTESRSGKRFPLQLPIRVAGTDGVTRNVSAAGIYLDAAADVSVGAEIQFDLTLPAAVVGGDCDVHVMCTGHVVRVEKTNTRDKDKIQDPDQTNDRGKGKVGRSLEAQAGLACVIDRYKMTRAEKSC